MSKSSKKHPKTSATFEVRKYSQPSEGALDLNYYVKGKMKDGNFYLAKIIDCRPAKDLDPKKKKNDFSYEYYLHYMDFDRRMDEWVPRSRLEPTRDLIEEKKEKAADKEHEGTLFFFIIQQNFLEKILILITPSHSDNNYP